MKFNIVVNGKMNHYKYLERLVIEWNWWKFRLPAHMRVLFIIESTESYVQ